jgi:hypothetical protein
LGFILEDKPIRVCCSVVHLQRLTTHQPICQSETEREAESPMRILMILYDKIAANYAAKGLTEGGHVCNLMEDGSDGLFQATRESYDLIVVD